MQQSLQRSEFLRPCFLYIYILKGLYSSVSQSTLRVTMDLTDTQLAAVKNWRPGDLMLSVPIGEKAANIILPIADDDGELMCWQPDYVCIACQNPLVCFVGFGEHIFNLELVAATICMNEERREYAEGFQLLESLSNLVSPNDAIIIKPDAATLRDLVNAGGCTSPHCQQGYMQSDHPVWDCDEVRGRMWNSQPAPRTFRVCPFCIGLDLADEHDEYLKVGVQLVDTTAHILRAVCLNMRLTTP